MSKFLNIGRLYHERPTENWDFRKMRPDKRRDLVRCSLCRRTGFLMADAVIHRVQVVKGVIKSGDACRV